MREIMRRMGGAALYGEEFDNAYRAAVVDTCCEIGDAAGALKWKWMRAAAQL